MRLTISLKLFLGLTLVCLTVVTTQALVTRWNFNRGLLAYVEEKEQGMVTRIVTELAAGYAREEGWQSLRDEPRLWSELLRRHSDRSPAGRLDDRRAGRPLPPEGPRGRPPPRARPLAGDPLLLNRRFALLDANGQLMVGESPDPAARRVSIQVDDGVVGYVSVSPMRSFEDPESQRFAEQQGRSLLLSAVAALLLAALASAILARQFNKPIRALVDAARAMTDGDFNARVAIRGGDELALLAADVNMLAETLERNRQTQRRWVTDIAHELRTPLAVLKGELEAIEDGIRAYNVDTIASLRTELDRLIALVGELHTLTLAEEDGPEQQMSVVDLAQVLAQALQRSSHRLAEAGITLEADLPVQGWAVKGNADQLMQVFLNIIENVVRYVDAPGTLWIKSERGARELSLVFSDSGPGVPDEALGRLFDRLYRVDRSRNRETGGSGLGLAICKSIVERHQGQISAGHAEQGGLQIRLTLPLSAS
ncbi:MAG: ATP-binding protein [Pseudomonadota bacterium]